MGGDKIHLIHPDGTGERTIGPAYSEATAPAWAPDSRGVPHCQVIADAEGPRDVIGKIMLDLYART